MIGYGMFDSSCYASYVLNKDMSDLIDSGQAMSVYCSCGRIVALDRNGMRLRMDLGKELECSKCRNQRISMEIDALNEHYNTHHEEEGALF